MEIGFHFPIVEASSMGNVTTGQVKQTCEKNQNPGSNPVNNKFESNRTIGRQIVKKNFFLFLVGHQKKLSKV